MNNLNLELEKFLLKIDKFNRKGRILSDKDILSIKRRIEEIEVAESFIKVSFNKCYSKYTLDLLDEIKKNL